MTHPDDVRRLFNAYHEATDNERATRDLLEQYAVERAAALAELHALGWSYRRIGEEVGLSHSRVAQLVTGKPSIDWEGPPVEPNW